MKVVLLLCLILGIIYQAAGDTGGHQVKDLPLPSEYSVRSEVNYINHSYSISLEERVNTFTGQYELISTRAGKVTHTIFDNATSQLFTISGTFPDKKCTVETTDGSLDKSVGTKIFFYQIFNTAKQLNLVYKGDKSIRGIHCDYWLAIDSADSDFSIQIYFTNVNWSTVTQFPAIPVRAVLFQKGVDIIEIDYFDYNPQIPENQDYFQTPVDVFCPGRKISKALPPLPPTYHFTSKFVVPSDDVVDTTEVWYDKDEYMIRVDRFGDFSEAPYWVTDPIAEIQDYASGVVYAVNQARGNCTVMPMGDYMAMTKGPDKNGSYPFPNPEQLLHLDADYVYIGQRYMDDIQMEVYQTNSAVIYPGSTSLLTMFYTPKLYENLDGEYQYIPYLLLINTKYVGTRQLYITGFSTDDLKSSELDLSSCWTDDDTLRVRILFPDKFIEIKNASVTMRQRSVLENVDVNACADACENSQVDDSGMYKDERGFYCSSLTYCDSTRQCTLFEKDSNSPPSNPASRSCVYKQRSSVIKGITEPILSVTYSRLKSMINSKSLQVSLEIDGKPTNQYTATVVEEDDTRSINGTEDYDLQEFTVYQPNTKLVGTSSPGLYSLQDCATRCVNHPTTLCPVFSLCYTTGLVGHCTVGSVYPDANVTSYTTDGKCTLYTRKYLSWFNELPGYFPPPSSGSKIDGVPTAEQCAKQCYKMEEHSCDIFYFDVHDHECWISQALSLDLVGFNGSNTKHYQFKAFVTKHKLYYFEQTTRTQLTDKTGAMMSDVTAEDCAETYRIGSSVKPNTNGGKTTSSGVRPQPMIPPTLTTGVDIIVVSAQPVDCARITPQTPDLTQSKFKLYKEDRLVMGEDTTSGNTASDCMYFCLTENRFQCESLGYCPDTGECRLNRYHPDINPGVIVNQPECQVYTRNYGSEYDQLPGTFVPGVPDKEVPNSPSAEICAKFCTELTDFTCRSFDYCPDTSQCLIWKTHDQEHSSSDREMDTSCSHYCRNYLPDFQLNSNKSFASNIKYELHIGVTPSQCAQLCVEEEEVTCKSFVVCPNSNQCRLLTVHPKNDSNAKVVTSTECNLYTREHYRDVINPATSTTPTPGISGQTNKYSGGDNNKPGYSTETVTGIGIGVFLGGVVIGLISYHLIKVVKNKRTNDLEMNLLKNRG
ncbi:hypothetical protein LOTGIDRAFT_157789 [Lottia gigantea]|uniref:Apple domain-containing protein n=1 Tax=Lottia gigantea TaxID=225164 RepID=V4AZF9_LOTGI|nr:hypothetical protein LOTGIDRAFT_157789 [Lottia gigantea]ESP00516.1 hypothetical protein LOTGIDRAFT_157789 [Lottia gigantea]